MYSPLHNKIAKIYGRESTALVSCLAKKVYLTKYSVILATTEISKINSEDVTVGLIKKIRSLKSHHHSYVEKIEGRSLKKSELEYMSKYYIAIRKLMLSKEIGLVILHNDLRWYHAIAIEICNELKIKYIVTEQGLIRPSTTVLDRKGVNANSSLMALNTLNARYRQPIVDLELTRIPGKHDSSRSMLVFAIFMLIFSIERLLGSKTILRYMHNNYSKKKYINRLIGKLIHRKNSNIKITGSDYILLLLQLENDTQMLVHSRFSKNSDLIKEVEKQADKMGVNVFIKKHPLDENSYSINDKSQLVSGCIKTLAKSARLVITINSSAAIDVLKTDTPLFLLGESIYNIHGVGRYVSVEKISDSFAKIQRSETDSQIRKNFIDMLKNEYLLDGAGFNFPISSLEKKVDKLLEI